MRRGEARGERPWPERALARPHGWSRSVGAAPPGVSTVAAEFLQLQHTAGNRAVQRLITAASDRSGDAPVPRTLTEIAAAESHLGGGTGVLRAGTPVAEGAPGGIGRIQGRSSERGAGITGGLTQRTNAAGFTAPMLTINGRATMTGSHTRLFEATVEPTSAPDRVHPCFYAGPGYHDIRAGPRNARSWAYVSDTVSSSLRDGEQEHLDDARRAYDLSYGLVEREINALAARTRAQPFRSTSSPSEAQEQAEAALAARLPPAFGATPTEKLAPSRWAAILDRLLERTERRDRSGWHYFGLTPAPETHEGRDVYTVGAGPGSRIGEESSAEVVHY